MNSNLRLPFLAVLAGAVPLHAQTPPPPPPPPIPIVLAPWEKTVTLPAEAAPYFRVTLGTPVTGWVDSVKADIGSELKKGDLLAEIRAPELVAARDAAAESEFTRLRQLAGAGTVTTKVSDESEARSAAAKARVAEAEAGVASAKAAALAAAARATEAAVMLEYTRLVAPYDGRVVARHAELGDFLATAAEGASLFTYEQTDPLRIKLHVPEHAAALTKAGQAVTLKLGGREFKAELARVSGSLDPVTRTVTAEVDLSGSGLLPGTFGTATMTLAKLESAALIPLGAVKTESDGSRYVLVSGETGEKKVPVTLHTVEGLKAVLTGDLVAGQSVLP
jgi:RND family efflux transporter MFP subunit